MLFNHGFSGLRPPKPDEGLATYNLLLKGEALLR